MQKCETWIIAILCVLMVGYFSSAASSLESCGAYSLDQLCLLLGVNTDSIDFDRQIEQRAGKNLASFADLVTIAKQMGLHLQGMSMTFEQLQTLEVPVIAHLKAPFKPDKTSNVSVHFIVVEKVSTKWVRIFDNMLYNNKGSAHIVYRQQFTELWTGNVLVPTKLQRSTVSPQLVADPNIHDFGTYQTHQGSVTLPKLAVTLRNEGDTPIKIIGIQSSCSCAVVRNDTDVIKPREENRMEIEWKPGPGDGMTSTTVQIETDQPNRPFVFVSFVVTTENSVYAVPNRLYIEVKPPLQEVISRPLEIQNLKQSQIHIQEIVSSSPYIKADSVENTTIQPGQKAMLQIRVEIPTGKFSEQITIRYTDNKLEEQQIIVPIDGKIHDDVSVSPKRFFFGAVEVGKPAARTITLSVPAGTQILKTETDVGKLQVEALEQGDSYRLQLMLDTSFKSRIQRGNVSIYTNHPFNKVINVPVFALMRVQKNGKSK